MRDIHLDLGVPRPDADRRPAITARAGRVPVGAWAALAALALMWLPF
jgi:hypothetical protein